MGIEAWQGVRVPELIDYEESQAVNFVFGQGKKFKSFSVDFHYGEVSIADQTVRVLVIKEIYIGKHSKREDLLEQRKSIHEYSFIVLFKDNYNERYEWKVPGKVANFMTEHECRDVAILRGNKVYMHNEDCSTFNQMEFNFYSLSCNLLFSVIDTFTKAIEKTSVRILVERKNGCFLIKAFNEEQIDRMKVKLTGDKPFVFKHNGADVSIPAEKIQFCLLDNEDIQKQLFDKVPLAENTMPEAEAKAARDRFDIENEIREFVHQK